MVLMLTVGRWADVLHILMCFLGEASCLLPTMDLLNAASSEVSESPLKQCNEVISKLGQNIKRYFRLCPKMTANQSNLSTEGLRSHDTFRSKCSQAETTQSVFHLKMTNQFKG